MKEDSPKRDYSSNEKPKDLDTNANNDKVD